MFGKIFRQVLTSPIVGNVVTRSVTKVLKLSVRHFVFVDVEGLHENAMEWLFLVEDII